MTVRRWKILTRRRRRIHWCPSLKLAHKGQTLLESAARKLASRFRSASTIAIISSSRLARKTLKRKGRIIEIWALRSVLRAARQALGQKLHTVEPGESSFAYRERLRRLLKGSRHLMSAPSPNCKTPIISSLA